MTGNECKKCDHDLNSVESRQRKQVHHRQTYRNHPEQIEQGVKALFRFLLEAERCDITDQERRTGNSGNIGAQIFLSSRKEDRMLSRV